MIIGVKAEWEVSGGVKRSFRGRMTVVKGAVQRWPGDQFLENKKWISVYEEALKVLLTARATWT